MNSESQAPDGGWELQVEWWQRAASCWFAATCSMCQGPLKPEGQGTCQLFGSHFLALSAGLLRCGTNIKGWFGAG